VGALGVGESEGAEFFLLSEIGGIERGVGVLARDFLKDDRVVGLRGISLEKEREGGFGIETRFSGLGLGEERRGGGRRGRAQADEEKNQNRKLG
jgi:hypothetical protein